MWPGSLFSPFLAMKAVTFLRIGLRASGCCWTQRAQRTEEQPSRNEKQLEEMQSAQKSFSGAAGWQDAVQESFRDEFNKPTADITKGSDCEPCPKKHNVHSAICGIKEQVRMQSVLSGRVCSEMLADKCVKSVCLLHIHNHATVKVNTNLIGRKIWIHLHLNVRDCVLLWDKSVNKYSPLPSGIKHTAIIKFSRTDHWFVRSSGHAWLHHTSRASLSMSDHVNIMSQHVNCGT